MKKIVFVAQSNGGVEEYLYMFLKRFQTIEYEKYLIVSEQYRKQEKRFTPFVKKIYYIDMVRNLNFISDLQSIVELKKIIKKINPDIVYLHSSKAGGIGRIALWFNRKIKIIYNAHGWFFNADIGKKKKNIYILLEKILAIRADMIVNISKDEYKSSIKNKIASEKKQCIIENAIDLKKFENIMEYNTKIRKKYNIGNNEKIIGVVGRVTEQKDPITAIKAFNIINKKFPHTRLMYVGAGNLKNEVITFAKENNIEDKIIITGWVENVERYISSFDIAILPSKWEGFGLVILEYMASGKPIVASGVGGIKDLIKNNENGYLFCCGDYEKMAKLVEDLITNQNKKDEFIKYNLENVKKFNIEKLINQHIELFNKLLV